MASPIVITPQASIVAVNTNSNTKTLILPSISSCQGFVLEVKDYTGNANNSTITFSTIDGNTIEGTSSTYVLSNAYGSVRLFNDSSNWRVLSYYVNTFTF